MKETELSLTFANHLNSMLFLLIPAAFTLLGHRHLLVFVSSLGNSLHGSCADMFSGGYRNEQLASAIVCGTKIYDAAAKQTFSALGLLHLLVVSGIHLQLLSLLLHQLLPKPWTQRPAFFLLHFCLLFFYLLVTGFHPPVVRAFFFLLLTFLSWKFRWSWSRIQKTTFVGLLLLALEPDWIFNFSFYLSWLANIALSFGSLTSVNVSKIRQALHTWPKRLLTRLTPIFVSSLSVQAIISLPLHCFSLLAVFGNILLAPFLTILIFPLSLSLAFRNEIGKFGNQAWDFLFWLLERLSQLSVGCWGFFDLPQFPQSSEDWTHLWIYLASITAVFWYLFAGRFRGQNI